MYIKPDAEMSGHQSCKINKFSFSEFHCMFSMVHVEKDIIRFFG